MYIRQVFICEGMHRNLTEPNGPPLQRYEFSRVVSTEVPYERTANVSCPSCGRMSVRPSHEYRTMSPEEARQFLVECDSVLQADATRLNQGAQK